MCAAPGGKTTHLAQLTGDKCQIYAGERSKGKLPSFHQLLSRLNIKSVIPIHIDSTKSLISTPVNFYYLLITSFFFLLSLYYYIIVLLYYYLLSEIKTEEERDVPRI